MLLVLCVFAMNRTPSTRSPRAGLCAPSQRALQAMCITVLVGFGSAAAFAQDPTPDRAIKEYARAISQAHADLQTGRVSEARKQLGATDRTLRSFEYEYLLARAMSAAAKGAAPDLIRTIATPKIETRYGVLNEVDRRLAFICRGGSVQVHDLNAPEAQPKIVSHEGGGAVWSGAFSRDGKTFVAGHENGDVVVWDAKTWKLRHTVSLGEKWPVRELAVAPDGSAFVAESKAALELWSLADAEPKKVPAVGERYNFGEGLAFSPQGDLIATGGMFDIVLHNARTGKRRRPFATRRTRQAWSSARTGSGLPALHAGTSTSSCRYSTSRKASRCSSRARSRIMC